MSARSIPWPPACCRVCLDEATKVIAEIESGAKCYEFTVQLGARTDTGDAEGAGGRAGSRCRRSTPAGVEAALAGFRGIQQQVPPMYSALKRDGRPLYELARQGIEVERAARTIEIRRLELRGAARAMRSTWCANAPRAPTSGCSARTSRVALGTLGHLTRLRRTWVEPFRDLPMVTPRSRRWPRRTTAQNLLPPDAALQGLPQASAHG